MAEESRSLDLAERTRRNLDGAARGELDSILGDLAPDAVWEVEEYGFHVDGAPAIRSFMRQWTAHLDGWRFQLEEVTDLGHELVLVAYRQSGRAAGSSFALEDRGFQIYEWRNGLIAGIRLYSHLDEARAAAAALGADERAGVALAQRRRPGGVDGAAARVAQAPVRMRTWRR